MNNSDANEFDMTGWRDKSPAALVIAIGIKIVPKHKISPKTTLRACFNRWLR
jgi:hypothetical protein